MTTPWPASWTPPGTSRRRAGPLGHLLPIEDTDATVKQVGELGGSVVEDPQDTPYGRLAVVADATGASFRLMGPNLG